MIKKILVCVLLGLFSLSFMGLTTIDDNLDITMDEIMFHGMDLGIAATFTYSGIQNGLHIWTLTDVQDTTYAADDIELKRLINEYRQANGVGELIMVKIIWDECLQHNMNMQDGTVPFGHDGFEDRLRNIGKEMYVGYATENCGMGYGSPQAQLNGWINSPPHNANLLHPSLTHMGVSMYGGYSTYLAIQSN